MADNTTRNATSGGDVIRDIDKGGPKTPAVVIDQAGAAAESLVDATHPLTTGRKISTPTSVLTLPSGTPSYAAGQLIASSATAGSVVVPSFTAAQRSAGGGSIPRVRLYSNHTTGLDGIQLDIDLWSAAPTFTNGDNAAYAVATGAAGYLGSVRITMVQATDGAYGIATPNIGDAIFFALASGAAIFWTMRSVGAWPRQASKTFTIQPEIQQD